MAKYLRIEMGDGSKWDVPVSIIARNRAEHYAEEFDGDVEKSLKEDTLPLFEECEYEIEEWAGDNMNWEDVEAHAEQVSKPCPADLEDGWINGEKEVIEK